MADRLTPEEINRAVRDALRAEREEREQEERLDPHRRMVRGFDERAREAARQDEEE